jgi:hypothetical protein
MLGADADYYRIYSLLRELASEYLAGDIDDPELDLALANLLSPRFDLCAEFKRLYVYERVSAGPSPEPLFPENRRILLYQLNAVKTKTF